jgi:ParB family transcriptional regulator, chromosome partitioning protein
MAAKKNALGRGLGALITDQEPSSRNNNLNHNELELDLIEANPFQPRTRFEEESLNELASSIKELGIIQPVIVRHKGDGKYQLIAGERRYRAAGLAGLKRIPVYIRTADDQELLEMALVENIQREDLDAIEVAISYQRLIDECSLTQETMSERVGKKRSTVSNYIRLLKLPAEIQLGIKNRQITMGHARAIVNIEDPGEQLRIYNTIIKNDLSVRNVEEIVREFNEPKPDIEKEIRLPEADQADYSSLRDHLAKAFSTKIGFTRNDKGKGKIVIPFDSNEELERIVALLDKLNT